MTIMEFVAIAYKIVLNVIMLLSVSNAIKVPLIIF